MAGRVDNRAPAKRHPGGAAALNILDWDDGGPASTAWFGVEIVHRHSLDRPVGPEPARLELPLPDPAKAPKP